MTQLCGATKATGYCFERRLVKSAFTVIASHAKDRGSKVHVFLAN